MTAADAMCMIPLGIESALISTAMENTNSDARGSKPIEGGLTMTTIGIASGDDKGGVEDHIKRTTMTTTICDEGGDDKGGGES